MVSELGRGDLLITRLVRGLSHHLLLGAETTFSDDFERWEHLVDLGAVFMGFGVFLSNADASRGVGAFLRNSPYRTALNAKALVFLTALVVDLLRIEDEDIVAALEPRAERYYRKARSKLETLEPKLEHLSSLIAPNAGPYR